MKAIIFFILLTMLTIPTVFGQIKIGDNPQNIDPASVLELESSSKVLVITRVSTLEMEAITPQRGGIVYNTDTECINYYDGTQWINLCDAVNFTITNDPIINNRATIEITQTADGYNLEIAKNGILGDNIVDGGIGPDDIQDNSITQEKLAAESVGSSEIRQNAVGSDELMTGAIRPFNIANAAANQVLGTDENGIVGWSDSSNLQGSVSDGTTISGNGTNENPIRLGIDIQNEIDAKEVLLNKAPNIELGNSDILYPTQNAVRTYVNNRINDVVVSGDGDSINEQNLKFEVSNGNLEITDIDGTFSVPLTDLNNQILEINGNQLSITGLNGGNTITLPAAVAEIDGIVGNEILNATDGTLVRLGDGTAANPFTLDVAPSAIGTAELANNAITNEKLADNSVQSANITNETILSVDILNGTIEAIDLANNTVTTIKILDDNVTPDKIAEGANGQVLTTNVDGDVVWGAAPEVDGIIGNEITGPTDTTLEVSGSGTTLDPLTIDVTPFGIGSDEIALDAVSRDKLAPGTAADQLLQFDGTDWILITESDISATITEVDGIIGNEITGPTDTTLEVSGSGTTLDPLTIDVTPFGIGSDEIALDAVSRDKLAPGTAADQLLQFDGTDWILIAESDISATITEVDGIIGNEITGPTDTTLEVSGSGTTLDPLTIDVAPFGIGSDEIALDAVTIEKIDEGANGQVLTTNGTDVVWQNLTDASNTGSILFSDGDGGITENNNQLFWNNTTLKLGVGIPNPDSKLHVNGQVRASTIANGDGSFKLPSYRFQDDLNSGMWLANESELAFSTNSLERVRIIANGNVGIGVTIPQANLHVDGDIRAEGAITASGLITESTPDYVFQKYFLGNSILNPEYEFTNLSEIEKFVKANNHLPGIKSAAAIKEQGFWDLGEASRINLEKIEELFLHTIEQEKKIKQLESTNKNMASEVEALKAQMEEIKKLLLEKTKE